MNLVMSEDESKALDAVRKPEGMTRSQMIRTLVLRARMAMPAALLAVLAAAGCSSPQDAPAAAIDAGGGAAVCVLPDASQVTCAADPGLTWFHADSTVAYTCATLPRYEGDECGVNGMCLTSAGVRGACATSVSE